MELKQSLKEVASIFAKCRGEEEITFLLEDLLTPSEITEIGQRIEILRGLKKGLTQREIANELGISVTTVSRGSRIYNYQDKIVSKLV